MNRNTLPGARSAVALVGFGLLVVACTAGVGGATSAPAGSVQATPAAAATAGASVTATPSVAPAGVPATNPAAPSAAPAITTTTPAPRPTPPAAPTTRLAVATPAPAPQTHAPAPTQAANMQVGEPENGHSVAVLVGSEVTLVLHNTYWEVQGSSDPAILALVSGPVTSAAGPIACIPGSGCGTVTAVFRAVAPGRATITASRTSCGETLQCIGTAGAYEVTVVVGL
jgi:hypothetical protein